MSREDVNVLTYSSFSVILTRIEPKSLAKNRKRRSTLSPSHRSRYLYSPDWKLAEPAKEEAVVEAGHSHAEQRCEIAFPSYTEVHSLKKRRSSYLLLSLKEPESPRGYRRPLHLQRRIGRSVCRNLAQGCRVCTSWRCTSGSPWSWHWS